MQRVQITTLQRGQVSVYCQDVRDWIRSAPNGLMSSPSS